MTNLKYLIQFLIIIFLFIIFKILGLKISSILSGYILKIFGPLFRSNEISKKNLLKAMPDLDEYSQSRILDKMWFNYGRILSEYIFIKNFRNSSKYSDKIKVKNQNILDKIKRENESVIFISGHFNNFELMAMHIEKSGINLAAIYRPLNNKFLNPIMENIRKKYICKKQIKKGMSGTKELLKQFKNKISIALMIDQRVSQGIKVDLFNEKAFTTTIPAQFVKKFNLKVVPIYIERLEKNNFEITINEPIKFNQGDTIEEITIFLNKKLEKMILKNPDQWIWTHNRWK
tara:strand:+ start:5719 stop:6582 length:864 start_codon:yes stop_codon:yes gene_type:complete